MITYHILENNVSNINLKYSIYSDICWITQWTVFKTQELFSPQQVTTNVTWGIQPAPMPVPVWVIILAVLAGLLLLAVLVFVMYRVSDGLRKRGRKGKQKKRRGREEKREGQRSWTFNDDIWWALLIIWRKKSWTWYHFKFSWPYYGHSEYFLYSSLM